MKQMQMRSLEGIFFAIILSFFVLYPVWSRAVPYGESPYIYGIHDWTGEAVDFFQTASSGSDCVRGWIMIADAIGAGGSHDGRDFSSLTDAGFGVIVRLDYSWSEGTLPDPSRFGDFAATFADYVRNSRGDVHIWVVANEPNLMWGGRNFSPEQYAQAYMMVREAVHAVAGHESDQVLVAAMGIWAAAPELYGDWLYDYLGRILDTIGSNYDGFAIHAYTREFSIHSITTEERWGGGYTWRKGFRVYRDVCEYLRSRGIVNVPLYITEAGNCCDPPCDPYPDQNIGYFVAMYDEIDQWNHDNPDLIIRAVTPYRWTRNDDGTGRDFCIGCSAPLLEDLANAISNGQQWTDSGCPGAVTAPDDDIAEQVYEVEEELILEEVYEGEDVAVDEVWMGETGDTGGADEAYEEVSGVDSIIEKDSVDSSDGAFMESMSGGCGCTIV